MKPEKEKIDEVVELAVKAFETELNIQSRTEYVQNVKTAKEAYVAKFKDLLPNFNAVDMENKAKEIYQPLAHQYFADAKDAKQFRQQYQKSLKEFINKKQEELAAGANNPFYKRLTAKPHFLTQKENDSISSKFLLDVLASPVFQAIGISVTAVGVSLLSLVILGTIPASAILITAGVILSLIGTGMLAAGFYADCCNENEGDNRYNNFSMSH